MRDRVQTDEGCDLVLSSGFLAFAYHSGFLEAVVEAGIRVRGVMGTSSGALSGALYAAGYSPIEVAAELSRVPPIQLLRPSCRPWQGALDLRGVVARLREVLPPTFEDLERPFAVGVVDASGRHQVVSSGALPEAVAASAAIPCIFRPVAIPGQEAAGPFQDGGMVDRMGLHPWRQHLRQQQEAEAGRSAPGSGGGSDSGSGSGKVLQRPPPAILHLIARSSKFSGNDDVASTGEQRVTVIRSPRSNVNFFDLGEFEAQFEAARQSSLAALTGSRVASPQNVAAK